MKNKKLSTLREVLGSSFEETWIPSTQGCFVPSLVEIGSLVLEKKMKMRKVYNNDNDKFWSEKLTWAFGSGELKIHVEEIPWFQYTGKSTPCILAQVTNKNFQALLFKNQSINSKISKLSISWSLVKVSWTSRFLESPVHIKLLKHLIIYLV